MEDADDIAKRIASRAKNAIEEGSWGYYKNFGTWNYEGTVYIKTERPLLLFYKAWVAKVRARTHLCDVRSHVSVCVRKDF